MRKILINGLILCVLLCVIQTAQSFQRTDKTPDFFVPAGVLQTKPRQEKLPDVKQMQYQGQQAPVIVEMEQERLAKIAAEKQKRLEEKKEAERQQKYEKLKAQRKAETQKKLELLKKNIFTPSDEKIEKTEDTIVEKEKPVLKVDENADIHTRIIQEYAVDLDKISRGEAIDNKRLDEMLADWTDDVHVVE